MAGEPGGTSASERPGCLGRARPAGPLDRGRRTPLTRQPTRWSWPRPSAASRERWRTTAWCSAICPGWRRRCPAGRAPVDDQLSERISQPDRRTRSRHAAPPAGDRRQPGRAPPVRAQRFAGPRRRRRHGGARGRGRRPPIRPSPTICCNLLHKLAHHAEEGSPETRAEADGALRSNVARLIGDWELEDPNPEHVHRRFSKGWSGKPRRPADGSSQSGCEPEIIVKMALELDCHRAIGLHAAAEAIARIAASSGGWPGSCEAAPQTETTESALALMSPPPSVWRRNWRISPDQEVIAILVRSPRHARPPTRCSITWAAPMIARPGPP